MLFESKAGGEINPHTNTLRQTSGRSYNLIDYNRCNDTRKSGLNPRSQREYSLARVGQDGVEVMVAVLLWKFSCSPGCPVVVVVFMSPNCPDYRFRQEGSVPPPEGGISQWNGVIL